MSFRNVRVAPKTLRFSPNQREQSLVIENGSDSPINFELAAHRTNKPNNESYSLFQSNLPNGRLSALSRETILVQFIGEFCQLDTDCVETLQLLLRNDQQEVHLIVLDCEFELDETGASVIKSGKQIVRSDGLLLEEDTDAVYGGQVSREAKHKSRETGNNVCVRRPKSSKDACLHSAISTSKACALSGSSAQDMVDQIKDKEGLRPITRIGRKRCYRRLGWLSQIVFLLNLILFLGLLYMIMFSPVNRNFQRLVQLYGLHKAADECSFFQSTPKYNMYRQPHSW